MAEENAEGGGSDLEAMARQMSYALVKVRAPRHTPLRPPCSLVEGAPPRLCWNVAAAIELLLPPRC